MERKTRKTHTVREKLAILDELRNTNLSQRKFAASKGIHEATLRTWMRTENKLRGIPMKKIKKVRNVPRVLRGYFPRIDEELIGWIRERNLKGIRVKDKFIQAQALHIRDRIAATMEDETEQQYVKSFQASRLWCSRFKNRYNLVSRRHTTTHSLPANFREVAIRFIEEIQELCRVHSIPRERIINMDQVPRYFENDKSTTIAERGLQEILLRKSSTSHKKFTYTPFITASGKFLKNHALFSKLKNIPKHDSRCRVDVNMSGMWNETILMKEVLHAAKLARGVFSTRAAVLVILDSYGVHTKFVNERGDDFKAKNIHFALIPPRLTGLIQPLDVCLNRSFQQFFNDETDFYQSESLRTENNQTRKGNIKMPCAEQVTKWAADWSETKSVDQVRKAFDTCGLVPKDEFNIDNLHSPLRDVFRLEMKTEEWIQKYSSLVAPQNVQRELCQSFTGQYALLKIFYEREEVEEAWVDWAKTVVSQIDNLLKNDPLTAPIYHSGEQVIIKDGLEMTDGYLEAYACSILFNLSIHVIVVGADDLPQTRFMFGENVADIEGFYIKKNPLTIAWAREYDQDDLVFIEIENSETSSQEDTNNNEIIEEYLDSEDAQAYIDIADENPEGQGFEDLIEYDPESSAEEDIELASLNGEN